MAERNRFSTFKEVTYSLFAAAVGYWVYDQFQNAPPTNPVAPTGESADSFPLHIILPTLGLLTVSSFIFFRLKRKVVDLTIHPYGSPKERIEKLVVGNDNELSDVGKITFNLSNK